MGHRRSESHLERARFSCRRTELTSLMVRNKIEWHMFWRYRLQLSPPFDSNVMSTNQPTSNPKDLPNGQQNGPSTLLPTSPISPVAPFPPIREPAKRSRAPEFYGFVAWTSTSLLYILYLLWGFLPDAWIAWLGVEWYPSREWAILLPAYSIVLVLLTYFSYFALAFSGTASFSDINAIQGAPVVLLLGDQLFLTSSQTRPHIYQR